MCGPQLHVGNPAGRRGRRPLQPKAAIKQKTSRHPGRSVVQLDFVVGQQFGLLQQQPPLAGGKAAEQRQQLALVVRHRGFVPQQIVDADPKIIRNAPQGVVVRFTDALCIVTERRGTQAQFGCKVFNFDFFAVNQIA